MFWADSKTKRQYRKSLTNRPTTQENQAQSGHLKEQDHHRKAPWNQDQAQTKKQELETNMVLATEIIIVKSIL